MSDNDKTQTSAEINEWLDSYSNAGLKENPPLKIELKKDKETALEKRESILNEGHIQDQKLKGRIFNWVQGVVTIYLVFIAVIICFSLPLTPNVLIALLTTTSINIIGLPALIINSLFPKEKEKK
ncbi:MAG: hypothetical protein RL769_34 [Pseudomonadota bacterium]|jgi:hypothetical protein